MRKPLLLPLCLVALALLATSCRSNHKSSRQRYHQTQSGLLDTSARSGYVDARVREMTDKGMDAKSARAQASREWFRQASVPTETPTAWERQRRKAQADFETTLEKQKKEREAGLR